MNEMEREKGKVSFYSWVIVMASFMVFFGFFGTLYAFGIFLKPLAEEFGWSRAVISGAFSLSMAIQGVLSVVAGALCDRYGPRLVLAVSTLITALGYGLMFWLSNLGQFYLYYGVMVAIGGAAYVVPAVTIPRWMERHRGLAMGIVLSGIGMGQITLAPLATWILLDYGWREGYLFLGGVAWLMAFLPSFLFRSPPQPQTASSHSSTEGQSLGEALRSKAFWFMFLVWTFTALPSYLTLVHIIPHATDRGISPEAAALIMTIIGLVGIPTRLLMGELSDRLGNVPVYILGFLAQIIGLFWLVVADGLWAFSIIAGLFSIGYGGTSVIFFKVMPDFFGLKALGAIFGVVGIGWYIGAAIGPTMGGYIFDTSGGYGLAFLLGGLSFVLALGLSLPLFPGLRGKPSP